MRSFIAIELPGAVRDALRELQQELRGCGADVRWVNPEGIHLTLKFLGEIQDRTADKIRTALEGTCENYTAFNLKIKGTGVFPNMRAPRVVWAGIERHKTLTDLQLAVEAAVEPLGCTRERRDYSPHLTLGRFRSPAGKDLLMEKINEFRERLIGTIHAGSVSLMKSELASGGARYTRIAEMVFGRPAGS